MSDDLGSTYLAAVEDAETEDLLRWARKTAGDGDADVVPSQPSGMERMRGQVTATAPAVAAAAPALRGEGVGAFAADKGQRFARGAAGVVGDAAKGAGIAATALASGTAGAMSEQVAGLDREIAAIDALLAGEGPGGFVPEGDQLTRYQEHRARLAEQRAGLATAGGMAAGEVEAGAEAMPAFQAGEALEAGVADFVGAPDPARDGTLSSDVAEGLGQVAGIIGTAVVGGPVPAAVAAAGQGAVSLYEEAKAAGSDEATALRSAGFGILIGATDILPLMRAIQPLEKAMPGFRSQIVNVLGRVIRSAGEEAAQEALQTTLENLVAQGQFDPARGTFDGTARAALVGGIIGGIAGGGAAAAGKPVDSGRGPRPEAVTSAADPELASIDPEASDVVTQADMDARLGTEAGPMFETAASAEDLETQRRERIEAGEEYIAAQEAIEIELSRLEAEISEQQATATAGESLVDRIVGVESGGNATAKNPKSSATGAGQFIESTWLRMMKRHRPELMRGKSKAEVLALRNDPDLSREMVARLAEENSAHLRRNGVEPTDGRLYLAHFLGPDGAVSVLRAEPNTPLADVLGKGVLNANPFLKGKQAAWIVSWADGKMGDPASARARIGTLRARQTRLRDALGEYVANTSEDAAAFLRRSVDRLNAAASRVTLDDIGGFVQNLLDNPEAPEYIRRALDVIQGRVEIGVKNPLLRDLKARGGVLIGSQAHQDLVDIGVTNRSLPGIFKRDGAVEDLSALDPGGNPLYLDNNMVTDGRLDRDVLVAAIDAEQRGSSLLTAEEQNLAAEAEGVLASLKDVGLDPDTASAKDLLDEINRRVQEGASLEAALEAPDLEADPRDVSEDLQEDVTGHLDAPSGEPESVSRGVGEGKIYVNHARIQSSDDVRDLIQQMADLDADAINAKRGGEVVSNAQTIREADQEYRDIEDLLGREPGPMSRAEAVAARKILTSSGEQVMALAKKAQGQNATDADIAAFRRAAQVHYAIQAEVIAARTETARALQAWAIPAGSDRMRLDQINALVNADGGKGEIRRMAAQVASLEGQDPIKLNTYLQQSLGGRIGRALFEAWINGLLSSPKTHVVNVTSNMLTSVWAIPERLLTAGISQTIYGGEVRVGEALAQSYGFVSGMADGIRLAFALQNADQQLSQDLGYSSKLEADEGQQQAISAGAFGMDPTTVAGTGMDWLGKAIRIPGNLLGREDMFFKSIGYRMELHARAYRMATADGLKGDMLAQRIADLVQDPPPDLKADALDAAHYQTFTNELGEDGQSLQRFANRIGARTFGIPPLRFIVPFIRTPVNIMKYTLQRTPLALMARSIRADIKAGGPRGATALARIGMGTALMAAVYELAASGGISGGGPEDPELKRMWMADGNKPYSIRIGDQWVQYSRLDPIGMLMGFGADFAEIAGDLHDDRANELAVAGIVAMSQNLLSKTYMSGVVDFIAAVNPKDPTSDPARYLQNFAGTLMPYSSFLRHTGQAIDPVLRDTRPDASDEATTPQFLAGVVNKWKATIPGYSASLPARRNLWGEIITRRSEIGVAYDFMSPLNVSKAKDDPANAAMLENRVKIGMPRRAINGVDLTPEEYSEYTRIAGELAKSQVGALVNSPGWKRVPKGEGSLAAELLRSTIIKSRNVASAQMLANSSRLQQAVVKRQQEAAAQMMGN